MRFNGFSTMRATVARTMASAIVIAAVSALGMGVPFASAQTILAHAAPHPAISVVHSVPAHAPSHSRLASCGSAVPPAYGSGMEAILWDCSGQFHTEAINQTGYTVSMCASIYDGSAGGWHAWCNGSVPNGYAINTGTYSNCAPTQYQGAANTSVQIHTAWFTCQVG